jgi:hypothetical protein
VLDSNQRPTDYIPTTAFAAAHWGVWSLDFPITVPAERWFRWVPSSLYTFRTSPAWLGIAVAATRTGSPNLTPFHRTVSRSGFHRKSVALPTELTAHYEGGIATGSVGCKRSQAALIRPTY